MLQKSNLDTHSLSSQESNLTLLSNSVECIAWHIFSNCLFAMITNKFLLLLVDYALDFKVVWWIRLLKMRITCNFDGTRIIAYLGYGSSFVTL